jgi:hypothetical protein
VRLKHSLTNGCCRQKRRKRIKKKKRKMTKATTKIMKKKKKKKMMMMMMMRRRRRRRRKRRKGKVFGSLFRPKIATFLPSTIAIAKTIAAAYMNGHHRALCSLEGEAEPPSKSQATHPREAETCISALSAKTTTTTTTAIAIAIAIDGLA